MFDKLRSFASNFWNNKARSAISKFGSGMRTVGGELGTLIDDPLQYPTRAGDKIMENKPIANTMWQPLKSAYSKAAAKKKMVNPFGQWAAKTFVASDISDIGGWVKRIGDEGLRSSTFNAPKDFRSEWKDKGFLNAMDTPAGISMLGMTSLLGGIDDVSDVARGIKGVSKLDEAADVAKGSKKVLRSGTDWIKDGGVKLWDKGYNTIKNTPTGRFMGDLTRSSRGALERMGDKGKEISRLLNESNKKGDLTAGDAVVDMKSSLSKLSAEELGSFADVVEGKINAVSDLQQGAVNVWRKFAEDIAEKSKKLGVKVKSADGTLKDFEVRKNYFPVFLDGKKLDEIRVFLVGIS